MFKVDSCIDFIALSIILEFYLVANIEWNVRGVIFGILSQIISNNFPFCKEILKAVIELRHLDRVKGNFAVFDNKVYLATAIVKESQPIPHIIYCNISIIVE